MSTIKLSPKEKNRIDELKRQAGVPMMDTCSLCGRNTLCVEGTCANASVCKTGKDGPDHYP
jgi:hypothetical protein